MRHAHLALAALMATPLALDGVDNNCDGVVDLHWTVPAFETDDGTVELIPQGFAGDAPVDLDGGLRLRVMGSGNEIDT